MRRSCTSCSSNKQPGSNWQQRWLAIRAEDLARQKEIRSRKSRMDQRTRERLPVLPALLARANDLRIATATVLVIHEYEL
jgi:hypothetical protein